MRAAAAPAGVEIAKANDVALLPGHRGYLVRRSMPEPFSLGEPEEVSVVVQNRSAAGLLGKIADRLTAAGDDIGHALGENFGKMPRQHERGERRHL